MFGIIKKIFSLELEYISKQRLYRKIFVNSENKSKKEIELIKKCKNILIENNVKLNKIRFITNKKFSYDIKNNNINPKYIKIVDNKNEIVYLNKPENLIRIELTKYVFYDKQIFFLLKNAIKNVKRGIVIKAFEEINNEIWMCCLDDEINEI